MSTATLPSEQDLILTKADAKALLEADGRTVLEVVRCCDDGAILFRGDLGRPMTAWTDRDAAGSIGVSYEPGWVADPGPCRSWKPRTDQTPTSED